MQVTTYAGFASGFRFGLLMIILSPSFCHPSLSTSASFSHVQPCSPVHPSRTQPASTFRYALPTDFSACLRIRSAAQFIIVRMYESTLFRTCQNTTQLPCNNASRTRSTVLDWNAYRCRAFARNSNALIMSPCRQAWSRISYETNSLSSESGSGWDRECIFRRRYSKEGRYEGGCWARIDMRTEKMWTFCANDGGVVNDVDRIASRSLRRAKRKLESSVEADDWPIAPALAVVLGPTEDGLLVGGKDGLTGRESIAASRFLS